MEEQKPTGKKVEWAFSFGDIGASINRMLTSMGVGTEEAKTAHFSESVGSATSAYVELDLSVGATTVKALAASSNLIEADITYTGEIEFTVQGDTEKSVKLGQNWAKKGVIVSMPPLKDVLDKLVKRSELRWDVRLNPDVSLRLKVDDGVGAVQLDLSGLKLEDLKLEVGVGTVDLTLPAVERHYNADIEGGVGQVQITIQPGAALNLDIDGGVGNVTIRLPAGAAVRLEAEQGLGQLRIPAPLSRRGDDIWETPGFSDATRQITIHYDGGVGGLNVVI